MSPFAGRVALATAATFTGLLFTLLSLCAIPQPVRAEGVLPEAPYGNPIGIITGVVRSAADGSPLNNVAVALYGESPSFPDLRDVYRTGPDGQFRFETTVEDVYKIGFNTQSPDSLYVSEYYSGALTTQEAMTIAVGAGTVVSNVNASLMERGPKFAFATSSAFSDTLFAYYPAQDLPDYRVPPTSIWTQVTSAPWWNTDFISRDAAVGLAPRALGDPVRFLVAMPTTDLLSFRVGSILYRSGDGGASWASFTQLCGFAGYFAPQPTLITSPGDPSHLFLLTTCAFFDFTGIYRASTLHESKDGGINWTLLHQGNAASEIIRTLAIDSDGASTLYVRMDSAVGEQRPLRWVRWNQSSQSWQTLFDLENDRLGETLLAISWTDSSTLFLIATSGLRSSIDGGATWSQPTAQPCVQDLIQLLVLPGADNALLLRCGDGLFRSLDGGASWQRLNRNPGRHLAVDQGHQKRLIWAREGQLWESTDRGDTWNEIAGPQEDRLLLPNIRRK